jgi:IS30 family transposase
LNALAILKIQVHRDRGKELADNRRFTLATNIEVYFCDPQSPWQRGSKFEEGPLLAQRWGNRPAQLVDS